jgi:malonyl-CoA O-methyltransferase
MASSDPALVFRDIQRRFDRIARDFADADFVHRVTFAELIERLRPVVMQPRQLLDLGCATGAGSRQLARHYRRSRIIGLDASFAMLREATGRRSLLYRPRLLQADARRIPLQDGSMDLVFANMILPCIDDQAACLSEIARVLRKDGVFAFATFGPDSLSELREAWKSIDDDCHVSAFPDMHDLGDALLRAGFRDAVLDVDHLDVTYRDTAALYRDLTRAGARNCLRGRRQTLTGKSRLRALDEHLAARMNDNVLSLRLELVYGHAWGGGPRGPSGEFRVDPRTITHRTRN